LRNILIAVIVALALSVAGVYTYFSGKEYVVKVTELQIQDKMQETLPLTKTYLFIFQITLDSPRVELVNGSDRIKAGLDLTLNIQLGNENKPLGGSVDASGGVRYVSSEGSFYLTDPVVEHLTIQGVPQEYTDRVTKVVESALAEYYSTHPAYQLKAGDLKQAAAKLVLRGVIIENQELVVTLGI
jgi:hypothetical protein